MAKRKFILTDKEQRALQQAYEVSKNAATRTRYQAVRLYGTGYSVKEIMNITGCSRTSLMEWCQDYRENGLPGLVDKRVGGNSAKLRKLQIEDLGHRLREYTPRDLFGPESGPYWTVPDLARAIKQWYGVEYRSPSSYLRMFAQCNFSYQKVEKIYKSRSERKVLEFEEQVEKN
jgi:transposase